MVKTTFSSRVFGIVCNSFLVDGGKFRRTFAAQTKKDRRGRNLRLSLRDYHSLPLIIAQFQASCKRRRKGSPILPKTIPLKTRSFVESCKGGEARLKKLCRTRMKRITSNCLWNLTSLSVEYGKIMWILLCTLRIDKLLTFGYNKARNQRSTAEAQTRANPADLKQKGAKTDGWYGTRTVWTDCRGSLRSKTEAHHKRDVSPV